MFILSNSHSLFSFSHTHTLSKFILSHTQTHKYTITGFSLSHINCCSFSLFSYSNAELCWRGSSVRLTKHFISIFKTLKEILTAMFYYLFYCLKLNKIKSLFLIDLLISILRQKMCVTIKLRFFPFVTFYNKEISFFFLGKH